MPRYLRIFFSGFGSKDSPEDRHTLDVIILSHVDKSALSNSALICGDCLLGKHIVLSLTASSQGPLVPLMRALYENSTFIVGLWLISLLSFPVSGSSELCLGILNRMPLTLIFMYSACLKSLCIPHDESLIFLFYISVLLGREIKLDSLIGNHMGHAQDDDCVRTQ